jgi:ferric-dicitrate binding protein FerR (iron transport regulator)
MKLADEDDVFDTIKQCWDATSNQHDSSWSEIKRTVQSAGSHMAAARAEDEAIVTEYLRSARR